MIIILILCYFFPTIIAFARSHPNGGAVFIVNLFLGWTFLGWVIALAMSCSSIRREVREITVRIVAPQQAIPLALVPSTSPVASASAFAPARRHVSATDKLYNISHPAPAKTHWEKLDYGDDVCSWLHSK